MPSRWKFISNSQIPKFPKHLPQAPQVLGDDRICLGQYEIPVHAIRPAEETPPDIQSEDETSGPTFGSPLALLRWRRLVSSGTESDPTLP